MKKIYIILLAASVLSACSSNTTATEETKEAEATIAGNYGHTDWDVSEAITAAQMLDSLKVKDSVYTTVSGNITAACEAKGCWMIMDVKGKEMMVKFKDYGFFVPKNSADHFGTMRGWAYMETVSVAEQKEIARDANFEQIDIDEIKEPQEKLTFMAEGVIIK